MASPAIARLRKRSCRTRSRVPTGTATRSTEGVSPLPWLHRVSLNLCYSRLSRRRLDAEPDRRDRRAHGPRRSTAARRAGRAVGAAPDRPRGHRGPAREAPERRRPVLPPPPVAPGDRAGPRNPARHRQVAAALRAAQPPGPPRGRSSLRRRLSARPAPTRPRSRPRDGAEGCLRAASADAARLRRSWRDRRQGPRTALAHLDRCGRCTEELESMVLTITALRRLGDDVARAEPEPDAWPRLRARLDRLNPKRWVIMSPSTGMVMSVALVAVLVAPLQLGGPTSPSSAPAGPSAAEQAASREASRVEAAYIASIRQGTLPATGAGCDPADRNAPRAIPRRHPSRTEGGEPGGADWQAAGGYLTPMGSMPIVRAAQEPNGHVRSRAPL